MDKYLEEKQTSCLKRPLKQIFTIQSFSGSESAVGDGADGGAVQVRVHGRAALHRDSQHATRG